MKFMHGMILHRLWIMDILVNSITSLWISWYMLINRRIWKAYLYTNNVELPFISQIYLLFDVLVYIKIFKFFEHRSKVCLLHTLKLQWSRFWKQIYPHFFVLIILPKSFILQQKKRGINPKLKFLRKRPWSFLSKILFNFKLMQNPEDLAPFHQGCWNEFLALIWYN